MATCDPKVLPTQATCFRCVPPDAKRLLEIYLLNSIAGGKSIGALAAGAAQYRAIHDKMALAAKVYLLAVINGISTSPAALEKLAACWQCIPVSERLDVEAYLYATAAGGSTDPKVLTKQIGSYRPLYPIRDQVEIYLLNAIAGITIQSLMAGLACVMCLSTARLEEIYLYLLCLGISGNIVPPGSSYGPGATPEFDLTVSSFTTYTITWGANDLYVVICGVRYNSTGAGNSITVFTKNCTVMQFFGTFAGTSVTAKVSPNPAHPVPATPTGFTWAISAGNAVAGWNAPPAGVAKTELWTSTDNITFTLAATTLAPGTSASVAAPAVGTILYAEIRFIDSQNGYSTFTSVLSVVGTVAEVDNWVARVVANGGATPSANTQGAMSTFVNTLKGGTNVWGKLLACNVIAPDSLIAAITPLIKGTGNDPWTNHNFVAGDLTVNGLLGDGSSKYLDTGLVGTTSGLTNGSAGLGVYVSVDNATGAPEQQEMGAYGAQTNSAQGIDTHYNTNSSFAFLFRFDNGGIVTWAAPANPAGFYSVQRTTTTRVDVYFANSGQAHSSLANNTGGTIGAPENLLPMFAFATNSAGAPTSYSKKRLSFIFESQGLSSADDQTLYNAIQALRTSFGGGFV